MTKTSQDLANAIIDGLEQSYDLVYVDYRDELTDKQVAFVVNGDEASLFESLEEFESESRWNSVKQITEELQREVIAGWQDEDPDADFTRLDDDFCGSDEWEDVRSEVEARDKSDWLKQLISQSGRVLLRINCIDEDNGFAFQEVNPLEVLSKVGIEPTEQNERTVADTLLECSPEYSVLLGYWIVGADLEALYALAEDAEVEVEITDPYLYLGNPFSGTGYIAERPLVGKVRVKREDLRSDKDAFGYSINEIFGGVSTSSFEAEIHAVDTTEKENA